MVVAPAQLKQASHNSRRQQRKPVRLNILEQDQWTISNTDSRCRAATCQSYLVVHDTVVQQMVFADHKYKKLRLIRTTSSQVKYAVAPRAVQQRSQ